MLKRQPIIGCHFLSKSWNYPFVKIVFPSRPINTVTKATRNQEFLFTYFFIYYNFGFKDQAILKLQVSSLFFFWAKMTPIENYCLKHLSFLTNIFGQNLITTCFWLNMIVTHFKQKFAFYEALYTSNFLSPVGIIAAY